MPTELFRPVIFEAETIAWPKVTACEAGKFPIVTELPIVTDEMEMGTVPLIDAVTEPICAVPAPRLTEPDTAGRELTVTVVDASETGCVA